MPVLSRKKKMSKGLAQKISSLLLKDSVFLSSLLVRYSNIRLILHEAVNHMFRLVHSIKVYRLTTAGIEINNTCNLKCLHCPTAQEMKREKGYMDYTVFKHIIDLNPELERVYLTNWGEPLLHPQLVEMISYAHSKGKQTAITTNGTILDRSLSKKLIESGLDIIKFSVDGNRETYQKIRGFSYDKVESRIIDFIEIRNALKKGTWVEVSMLVFDETKEEINSFLKKWKPKANFVNLQPKFFTIKKKKYKPCRDLWRILEVLWDGTVVPCCADFEGELVIGNAASENLQKLFRGQAMKELRKRHLQKKLPNLCTHCSPYYADYHLSKKKLAECTDT